MQNRVVIKKKINVYNKKIIIPGDKSISIRWVLISSIADGISKAQNLLISEDVLAAIKAIKKLGVKVNLRNQYCKIYGVGIDGYKYKKGLIIDSQNSATLGRLLCGILVKSPFPIKIIGDKSLSKRDFKRIAIPLKKFGVHLKLKNNDLIEINKIKKIKPLNYKIPSDLSSSAFFIILTLLSRNSSLLIRNVNINPSRIGVIAILKKMGAKISIKNQKIYKGEKIGDIFTKSSKKLNSVNCPTKFNSSAIDEMLLIFLCAARASGVSYFKDLAELNKKESPRLKWGAKILNKMGIKTITTKDSIKIFGNPNLKISKKIVIKDFLKDHRVFMTSVIAALSFGGIWTIKDKESINSSFPNFLKILKNLGATIN